MFAFITVVAILLSSPPVKQVEPQEITVRGRAVCLDSTGESGSDEEACDASNGFAFRVDDETLYRFVTSDKRLEMLTDPRVRAKELEIVAWLREDNQLEIIKLYSVHDGELHDIYYRCDVCNITAHTPGPCWCCYQEFELRETPKQ